MKEYFENIADAMVDRNENVSLGRMMSAPGIKYKNKVFAFYYNKAMVFKLGKSYDPVEDSIENFSLLNPFKNKPPLAGWFVIPNEHQNKWDQLCYKALTFLKSELD